jgi:hypothetical protein
MVLASRIQVGSSTTYLDATEVDAGLGAAEREAVFLADPTDAAARAAVVAAAPPAAAYGAVVRIPEPGSAAISQPPQNAASGVLLAANTARRGFVIHNAPTSTQALLVAFAAAAAAGAYTKRLLPGETWDRHCGYTGAISGIWEGAGGGHAAVTEES